MMSPGPAPSARPRPSGGFSPGMGNFGEHLDEAAMQSAAQQQAMQQQAGATPTAPAATQAGAQPATPREVGSLQEELVKRPAQDIVAGLKSHFDINHLLGITPQDTPEQQAKKQEFHSRYQSLNQEQQQVAQKKFQEEMAKKKQEEEEKELQKQQQAQAEQQAVAPPSSPKKGPIGPASGQSKKQSTVDRLTQQRQTLGNAGQKH